jgi:DNA polymerase-4
MAAGFKIVTRHRALESPTQLADQLYRAAADAQARGRRHPLSPDRHRRRSPETLRRRRRRRPARPGIAKRAKAERAMDKVRDKMGEDAVVKGRGFKSEE